LVYPEGDGRPYVDWCAIDEELTPILDMLAQLLPEMEDEVLEAKRKVMENKPELKDSVQTKCGVHAAKITN